MRTIVFDLLFAQPLGGAKYHGGGEYIKSVFFKLIQKLNNDVLLVVCFNTNDFIDEWIMNEIRRLNLRVCDVKNVSEIERVLQTFDKKEQVSFFTGMIYQYGEIRFPENVYAIGVCHGLRPIEKLHDLEEWRYFIKKNEWIGVVRYLFRKNKIQEAIRCEFKSYLKNFNVVITDSNHSEYSIRVNFPELVSQLDLYTFYAPLKHLDIKERDSVLDNTNQQSYIMMISANRWLKNSFRGVMAIDLLYEKGYLKDIQTKVFGNLPETIIKKLKNPERFEFLGYVRTDELEEAYKGCDLFFYPTLNEGFGLPPMEAMKYGKTCVVSAVCSLPEIYKDAVYYCNPYDVGEMANRILMAINSPISQTTILNRVNKILKKQVSDTDELCYMILHNNI